MHINEIYPLVIVADKYGGRYSFGSSYGKYLAFNMYNAPDEVFSDEITCNEYFRHTKDIIGMGFTPLAAAEDLARKLERG